MNHVERFAAVMNFQPVDRLPRIEWAVCWDKTVKRWHGDGVPEGMDLFEYFGLDFYRQTWFGPRRETFPAPRITGPASSPTTITTRSSATSIPIST